MAGQFLFKRGAFDVHYCYAINPVSTKKSDTGIERRYQYRTCDTGIERVVRGNSGDVRGSFGGYLELFKKLFRVLSKSLGHRTPTALNSLFSPILNRIFSLKSLTNPLWQLQKLHIPRPSLWPESDQRGLQTSAEVSRQSQHRSSSVPSREAASARDLRNVNILKNSNLHDPPEMLANLHI